MTSEQPWPSEWLRGVLELCVLRVLADGPTYGYAIITRLADSGLGTVKGGTIYPLLTRLESTGLVSARWRAGAGGPGRKYYELTASGRSNLVSTAAAWARFAELTGQILTVPPVLTVVPVPPVLPVVPVVPVVQLPDSTTSYSTEVSP